MAHNLDFNEKTGKHSYFGVTEPAWHGLGFTLDNAATAEEAVKYAGLDFTVEKTPVTMNVPSGIIEVPNQFVTYRTDRDAPLGVVGKSYSVIQNSAAFTFFDELVDRDEAIYHTAGVIDGGKTVWVLAKMPDYIRVGDDITEQYVLLTNSHDGSKSMSALITNVRVVCQNTLNIALRQKTNVVRIRHTKNHEQYIKQAHELLGISSVYKQEMEDIFTAMSKKKVTPIGVKMIIDSLYPKNEGTEFETNADRIKEQILETIEMGVGQDLVTAKGTLFGVYNGVTNYLSHVKDYGSNDIRMKSLLFGGSSNIGQKAFDLCLDVINNKLTLN
jgi:phage/plasmid-like protein (TIGR03299 family)